MRILSSGLLAQARYFMPFAISSQDGFFDCIVEHVENFGKEI